MSYKRSVKDNFLIAFDNNSLLSSVVGVFGENLRYIEKRLNISIVHIGNQLVLTGSKDVCLRVNTVLTRLYDKVKNSADLEKADIDTVLRMSGINMSDIKSIKIQNRNIVPRSPKQVGYLQALLESELVICAGPAGTGKTYFAVAVAVYMLINGDVDRIILSRPAVEAGENLGFLPGNMQEKIDPYLRPLYDALYAMLPGSQVVNLLQTGAIEIAPVAFMRGRTLSNSFIILDEAQNTSSMQMKMFLTRLGENSRMVVTGDQSQVDLPIGVKSGLVSALDILSDVEEIRMFHFSDQDVVRHDLVGKIVCAYDKFDRERVK